MGYFGELVGRSNRCRILDLPLFLHISKCRFATATQKVLSFHMQMFQFFSLVDLAPKRTLGFFLDIPESCIVEAGGMLFRFRLVSRLQISESRPW